MSPEPPVADRPSRTLNAGVAGGVACLLLALLVGVLIGRAGQDEAPRAAAPPQVVTVGGAAAGGTDAAGSQPASFTSDWPAGKRGFTVQLRALAKAVADAAAVAAAKQAAVAGGAPAAGALDSDAYGTLDPGRYVIFSGQFADRAAARKALSGLEPAFPDAKVVEVAADEAAGVPDNSSGTASKKAKKAKEATEAEQAAGAKAIDDLEKSTPEDYQKKSSKLPKTIVTPGKAPPKDSKPAGGGTETETFE